MILLKINNFVTSDAKKFVFELDEIPSDNFLRAKWSTTKSTWTLGAQRRLFFHVYLSFADCNKLEPYCMIGDKAEVSFRENLKPITELGKCILMRCEEVEEKSEKGCMKLTFLCEDVKGKGIHFGDTTYSF